MSIASPSAVAGSPARQALAPPGALQPLSRAGVVVLFVLALTNGAFLYLVPAQAETRYAWSITPSASAAFLGAGFAAGTVATGLVLFRASRWRSLRTLPPALFVLATTLLAATLVHADRFRWDYPPTWLWAFVYAGVPAAVVALWRRQEARAEPMPAASAALRPVRVLSGIVGGVLVVGAIALFAAPGSVGDVWPWELTPLLARAVASWYGMVGVMLLACARGLRDPSEAVIPYATLLAWAALLLGIAVAHDGDLVRDGVERTAWIASSLLLAALAVHALATARRAEGRGL
jgi:hypothetical protein